jgi:hypothetical protein
MLDRMTPRQEIFALVASIALLVFIVEMVRRRRLREEYSWLWIFTGIAILVLVIWFGLLKWLTHLIGAVAPVSTFYVFGILFLVVTNIYFSIKVSTLTTQVKNQAQRLAILDHYVQELRGTAGKETAFAPGIEALAGFEPDEKDPAKASTPAISDPAKASTPAISDPAEALCLSACTDGTGRASTPAISEETP